MLTTFKCAKCGHAVTVQGAKIQTVTCDDGYEMTVAPSGARPMPAAEVVQSRNIG